MANGPLSTSDQSLDGFARNTGVEKCENSRCLHVSLSLGRLVLFIIQAAKTSPSWMKVTTLCTVQKRCIPVTGRENLLKMTESTVHEPEEVSPLSKSGDVRLDTQEASQSAQRGPRKRTKTGCLTCRKRRIKCGEEKYFDRITLIDLAKPILQTDMFQLYQIKTIL
jgi:hypothetical protein